MKVAVFGGSGFLGYDFVRYALAQGGVEPVVYSSSARSLSNVARHEVDIRLYAADDPQALRLDDDTAVLVNFAHPFERRGGLGGREQIRRFATFVGDARRRQPALRLIHLSSMSVYEPFTSGRRHTEAERLAPPRGDRYAREKVLAETALRALPDAAYWQLHLRPTVVYGPFCGVWTDAIFDAFRAGDVIYHDLGGRIQPIHGTDVSRFIYERLFDFNSGTYNLPGPEDMSWHDFLAVFAAIAARGRLLPADSGARAGESAYRFYKTHVRTLMQSVRTDPAFDAMALRLAQHLPDAAVQRLKRILLGRDGMAPPASAAPASVAFGRAFFAADRLVAGARVAADFPAFRPRRLSDARGALADYYRYRYTDARFDHGSAG